MDFKEVNTCITGRLLDDAIKVFFIVELMIRLPSIHLLNPADYSATQKPI